MNTDKTGGAAFPTMLDRDSEGMTLLDYFAAKAMHAQLSHPDMSISYTDDALELISSDAYRCAAAMLEERKKYMNQ